MIYTHEVSIAMGNSTEWQWVRAVDGYDVSNDMLTPADSLSARVPCSAAMYKLARPDNQIQLFIDGVRVFHGIIDDRRRSMRKSEGSMVEVTARCKVGRLVDECAPMFTLEGLGLIDLVTKLVAPLFTVTTSNATNRRLIVGPRLRKHSAEPPISVGKGNKRKVEPGDRVWDLMQYFLEEEGVLAWSTADGKQIVVGKPNYKQPAQWFIVIPEPRSTDSVDGNVIEVDRIESLAERYSKITVVGSHKTSASERAVVVDGPGADGIGDHFQIRKRLIVHDPGIHNRPNARQRAEREQAERDGRGDMMQVTMAGHGQTFGIAERPALYAFDTIAHVIDAEIEHEADWYITGVRYTGAKSSPQRTTLSLVPVGTDLRMAG